MISSNSLRQMSSGGDLPAGSDEHSQYAGLQFSNLVTQGAGGEGSFPLPLDFPGTKSDESVFVPVLRARPFPGAFCVLCVLGRG